MTFCSLARCFTGSPKLGIVVQTKCCAISAFHANWGSFSFCVAVTIQDSRYMQLSRTPHIGKPGARYIDIYGSDVVRYHIEGPVLKRLLAMLSAFILTRKPSVYCLQAAGNISSDRFPISYFEELAIGWSLTPHHVPFLIYWQTGAVSLILNVADVSMYCEFSRVFAENQELCDFCLEYTFHKAPAIYCGFPVGFFTGMWTFSTFSSVTKCEDNFCTRILYLK